MFKIPAVYSLKALMISYLHGKNDIKVEYDSKMLHDVF